MEAVQLLVDKANLLPVHVQEQLLDFADFLLEKYGEQTQEEELDEATKELLHERLVDYKANKDKAVPADEVIQRLKVKYESK